jgi:HSP20 family protein
MTDKNVTKHEGQVPATEGPTREATYVPLADIRENEERVLLTVEIPGVDPKAVDVRVENDVLTIEGVAHVETPAGCRLVGQEYGVGRYRRDFTLSDSVHADGIKARVHDGLLELTLPKRASARTRKIAIEG